MMEGEYLEMANHFKEEMDKKDAILKDHKEKVEELKKILIVSYGFVRVVDFFSPDDELATECKDVLEMLRGYLSSMLDEYIL